MEPHPREEGWTKLLYAIIEQAVVDLRGLQQAGYVRGLTPQKYRRWRTRRNRWCNHVPVRVRGLAHAKDAAALCEFFSPGGGCQTILTEVGSPIAYDAIVHKLGGAQ